MGIFLSCSEDLGWDKVQGYDPQDGVVEIKFSVSESSQIFTRGNDDGNERILNDVALLVFDGSGNLLQREDLSRGDFENYTSTSETREFKYTIVYNDAAKDISNPKIIAVANSKSITQDRSDILIDFQEDSSKTLADLQQLESQYYKDHFGTDSSTAGSFLMSGEMDATNTIKLNRCAAKITLKDYSNPKNERDKDFYFYEDSEANGFSVYDVYNTADRCYVLAPLLSPSYYENNDKEKERSTRIDNDGYRYDSYANPTKTHESVDTYTYIVFCGVYKGTKGYYAITLCDEEGWLYDIEPNHWYEIKLEKVEVAGYSTSEEAMRHPFMTTDDHGGVTYQIHDHAPEILSMISDGVHELGVTPEVPIFSIEGSGAKNSTGEFIVKCYSADSTEPFDLSDLEIIYDKNNGWFSIDKGVKYDDKENTSYEDTSNTPGDQYKFTVTITRELYSDRTGTIKVRWHNLEREVTITFDSTRPLSDLCTATLTIIPESGASSVISEKYWDFISGVGTSNLKDNSSDKDVVPKLWGIDEESMIEDRVRTQGFHFPMPYGENKNWEYVYTLDFGSKLLEEIPQDQYILKYSLPKNSFFNSQNFECKIDGRIATIKLKGDAAKKSYEYAIGKIQFQPTVYGTTYYLNFDLYHTGFFHHESNSDYGFEDKDEIAVNGGYYYYEVIEMEGLHWLDRNLGAKSNRSYVRYEDDTYIGNPEASGKYYTIANEVKNYGDPDIVEAMCPPGYRIPTTSDWNALRLSANFTTQQSILGESSYMSTFYKTGIEEIGDVYFQKGGYYRETNSFNTLYSNFSNMGDGASGYYWTKTEAPGMEKEHIGNWLRSLYINGASSNFNNASIRDHKLMVRCIVKNEGIKEEDIVNHYISFNVHNISHVMLFTYSEDENGNVMSTPLYTFPGKAVGSASSVVKWQNFACITSADLDHMYAIFCKENKDKPVTIYVKDDVNRFKEAEKFTNSLLTPENAWEIHPAMFYDFCDLAKTRSNNDFPGTNIWKSEPSNCDTEYPEEDRQRPTPDVGDFSPEYPDRENIIWLGSFNLNGWSGSNKLYDSNIKEYDSNFSWENITEDTITLKVYSSSNGSGYAFQVFSIDNYGGWNQKGGTYEPSKEPSHESIVNYSMDVTEITLNLSDFRNSQGIVIQGVDCLLYGLTWMKYEGNDSNKYQVIETLYDYYVDLSEENGILLGENYDWSKITPGNELWVSIEVYWVPDTYIEIYEPNGGPNADAICRFEPDKKEYTTFKLSLTQDMINKFINKGILIKGKQGQLKKVELVSVE